MIQDQQQQQKQIVVYECSNCKQTLQRYYEQGAPYPSDGGRCPGNLESTGFHCWWMIPR